MYIIKKSIPYPYSLKIGEPSWGNTYVSSRNWGQPLGIFLSEMYNGIQNRFSLIYYIIFYVIILKNNGVIY